MQAVFSQLQQQILLRPFDVSASDHKRLRDRSGGLPLSNESDAVSIDPPCHANPVRRRFLPRTPVHLKDLVWYH